MSRLHSNTDRTLVRGRCAASVDVHYGTNGLSRRAPRPHLTQPGGSRCSCVERTPGIRVRLRAGPVFAFMSHEVRVMVGNPSLKDEHGWALLRNRA